jgi:hypothetical protein
VQQTREEGLILADVKIGKQAGNLVLLRRHGQQAAGRFDPTYASFMGIRRNGETCYQQSHLATAAQQRDSAHHRTTTLNLTRPWEHTAFWFFAHTALPSGTSFSLRGDSPDQPLATPCFTPRTVPGAKFAKTPTTAAAKCGKPAPTRSGGSSKTPMPLGSISVNPAENASGSPPRPTTNLSGSTPPTASTPGPCTDAAGL